MRPQPLICCTDVEASSRWYQQLLGLKSAHGGPHYERIVTKDGVLVMQLHHFEVEDHHGAIGNSHDKPYGNGVLLWFETDEFDAALERAKQMNATVFKPRQGRTESLGVLVPRSGRLRRRCRQSRRIGRIVF